MPWMAVKMMLCSLRVMMIQMIHSLILTLNQNKNILMIQSHKILTVI